MMNLIRYFINILTFLFIMLLSSGYSTALAEPLNGKEITKTFFGTLINFHKHVNGREERVLSLLKEAGIGWVRWVGIPRWNDKKVAKSKKKKENISAEEKWRYFEKVAQMLQSAGIEVMPTVSLNPAPLTNSDIDIYKHYLTKLVKTGKKYQINEWQIGNEPAGKFFDGSAEDYARILNISYIIIKKIDPCIKVVMAGWGGRFKKKSQEFIKVFLKLYGNQSKKFDIFDYHANYKYFSTDYLKITIGREIWNQYFGIRTQYNNASLRISEIGVPSGITFARESLVKHIPNTFKEDVVTINYTHENQANEMVKRYVFALSKGIAAVAWNSFTDKEHPLSIKKIVRTKGDHSQQSKGTSWKGLLYNNFEKKISFTTHQILVQTLVGSRFIKRIECPSKNTHVYRFSCRDKNIYFLWQDDPNDFRARADIDLPIKGKK